MSQIGLGGGESGVDSGVGDGGEVVLLLLISLKMVLLRCDGVVWKRRVGMVDRGLMTPWVGVFRRELVNWRASLPLMVHKRDAECHWKCQITKPGHESIAAVKTDLT